jgi:HD-GYP domain-containing protein (c-di-GMP phosphodiesterase class II)
VLAPDESNSPTVLASRALEDLSAVEGAVARSRAGVAELLLGLVRETVAARNDEQKLVEVLAQFGFDAFPNATHHALAVRDEITGELRPLLARDRGGAVPAIALSKTIVSRVMGEGCALMFTIGESAGSIAMARSVAFSRLETAICAPLMGTRGPFGVIQLDVRRPARGVFTKEDLDLLTVFASQAGLALEHLQMHQQQRRALQSTINALVHSLTLKDPEAARHSERVQAVAMAVGAELGLPGLEMEKLSVAAILHDLGKQGVRDELLFKPDRLTDAERYEMSLHAAHTQTILDMIEYPEELRDVPRIAAYHHEKLDGTGPFGVGGDDIPVQARVISVADVFDALLSPRVYKEPLAPRVVLGILSRGRGSDWDAEAVDALVRISVDVLVDVYGKDRAEAQALVAGDESGPAEQAA